MLRKNVWIVYVSIVVSFLDEPAEVLNEDPIELLLPVMPIGSRFGDLISVFFRSLPG